MKELNMVRTLDWVLNGTYRMIEIVSRVLLLVMVGSISYAVFGRFILSRSPSWAEELSIFCMVWLAILSSALAVRDGTHIRMTIITYLVPEKISGYLHRLSYVLLFVIGIVFVFAGAQLYDLFRPSVLGVLRISTKWLALVFPVAGVAHILMVIARIRRAGW